jgi:hypothetical protein
MSAPLVLEEIYKQAGIYGDTVGKVCEDPSTPWKRKLTDCEGRSRLFFVDNYNYFIDPEAVSHDDAFDEIERWPGFTEEQFDALVEEYGISKELVDKVKETNCDKNQDSDMAERNELNNNTNIGNNEGAERKYQCLEWWGPFKDPKGKVRLTRIITVNGICIWIEADPYMNQRSPYITARYRKDPGVFHGTGLSRILRADQSQLNILTNMKLEFGKRYLACMYAIREGSLVNENELGSWRPFGLVHVKNNGINTDLRNIIMPLVPGQLGAPMEATLNAQEVRESMTRGAGNPDILTGMDRMPGSTAVQFSGTANFAATVQDFNFKVFAEEFLKPFVTLILEHDQVWMNGRHQQHIIDNKALYQNENGEKMMDEEAMIKARSEVKQPFSVVDKVLDEGSVKFTEISFDDLLGEYDFYFQIDPQEERSNMEREIFNRSLDKLPIIQGILQQEGKGITINGEYIAKEAARKNKWNEQKIITMPPAPSVADTPGGVPGGGIPGQEPPGGGGMPLGNDMEQARFGGNEIGAAAGIPNTEQGGE